MENRTKTMIEERYGPLKQALLTRLEAGLTPRQISREWGIHYNTMLGWMDEEGIERRVTYGLRDERAAESAAV